MRRFFVLCFAIVFANPLFAQSPESSGQPEKKWQFQAGVQLNELIRQVFNFSNTTSSNTNPYLATFSVNQARSGWGVRTGVGYNYQSFTTEDGITGKVTKLDALRARLGVEKRFVLSSRWTAGVGLDAIYNYEKNNTKSVIRGFDTVTTLSNSKIYSYGGGPMAWLRYNITSKVLIGTESSYYFATGNQSDNIAITRRVFNGSPGGQLETSVTTVDNKREEGKLSVPVAFFLIVQF